MFLRRKNRSGSGLPIAIGALVWSLVLPGLRGYAQEKTPVVFGKVTEADFATPAGVDTSVEAVVIADIGIRTFERPYGNVWDGYLQHTKRMLILKRRGFEAATVTIPLLVYKERSEEINELKAATYNLERGKVVKTDLDKSGIFKEKFSENLEVERFTFPAVKEGSIIEFMYKEKSQFGFGNETWQFQGVYPCLWSEYMASIPSGFIYSVVPHCYLQFYIDKTETKERSDLGSVYGSIKTFHWVVRNVPALKELPYTTTIRNWVARVEIRPGGSLGWRLVSQQLLRSDRFGADVPADNPWLDKDLKEITAGAEDDLSKARKIYAYVRDHFSCNKRPGYMMTNTLKTVYNARSGSAAELNLLLTAMLDHEKMYAFPVVLSTRSNGFMNPMVTQPAILNYVICKLNCGSTSYFLDASDPELKYGQLPLECYNDYDVVVGDTEQRFLEAKLTADSLIEQEKVVVFLSNGEKGGLDGSVQRFPGIAEAMEIRKKTKGQDGEKKFWDQLRSGLTAEETVADLEIDSLRLPDEPMVINYSFHVATDSASDILYFTPILADRIAANPLKDVVRIYPVEMPYSKDANYILTMDIPNGYAAEELPKSEKVLLNDGGGYFEYVLTKDGDQIHLRTRIRLAKANFQPEEYENLRSFFSTVVEKESEQIVFKKKK